MKKIIYILTFLSIYGASYSQSNIKGIITYQATLNSDDYYRKLINDTTISKISKDAEIEGIIRSRPMNFILLLNKNEALFKPEFDLQYRKEIGDDYNKTGLMAWDDRTYYTNLSTDEAFFQSYWTKGVVVNLNRIDWTLTNETKKIKNFTCYKAITIINSAQLPGMRYISPVEAWYTPQISTSIGVQEFNGLPGLILELNCNREDGLVSFKAVNIELDIQEKILINKPTGNRTISEYEYVKLIEKLNESRF